MTLLQWFIFFLAVQVIHYLGTWKLYQKAGYQEICRIPDFTFWQGKMWQDIRMEKYV